MKWTTVCGESPRHSTVSPMKLAGLYISKEHNFFGHHGRLPGEAPMIEMDCIECVADHGIRSDRFFDHKPNYKGQITFFSSEIFSALCDHLSVYDRSPWVLRRNVLTEGVDLNSLVGKDFEVQGVRFHGTEECSPCYWMEKAFAVGAEAFLKGQGGLRARILTSGRLEKDAVLGSHEDFVQQPA